MSLDLPGSYLFRGVRVESQAVFVKPCLNSSAFAAADPLQSRNGHAEKRCRFCARMKLAISQRRWYQKEFARRKIGIGAAERAAQATNDCKLSTRHDLAP